MAEPADAEHMSLLHYVAVIWRRRWLVALTTVAMVIPAVGLSLLQDDVYESKADVLLLPRGTDSVFETEGGSRNAPFSTVETEIEVLQSDPVRRIVRGQLGSAPDVDGSRVAETEVMRVAARSGDPRWAARVASAYARAYVQLRREQTVDELLAASEEIQKRIADLQTRIDELDQQLQAAPPEIRARVEADVRPRISSFLAQQSLFNQKLDQLQVDAALKTGGAQLVRDADIPRSPVEPQPVRNGVGALAVGLLAGAGLALLRDRLDTTIRTKDDLERAAGVPVLGVVPLVGEWRAADVPDPLDLVTSLASPAGEAFRTLRTAVQLVRIERPPRLIQVTSPLAGEGKSFTAIHMALVMATTGQRVLLVDADLRRPQLARYLGIADVPGLTSVLAGDVALAEAVQPAGPDHAVRVLTAGPMSPNPSELLGARPTAEVFFELQSMFDVIMVDSAPVLPVTDAAVLSAWMDTTLLVVRAGSTTRQHVADAVEMLRKVDAPLVGAVLNGATTQSGYGYGYGYGATQPGTTAAAPSATSNTPR